MQKLKGLVLTTFIAFSSAFFVEATVPVSFTEKVEAACAPGEYFDKDALVCQKAGNEDAEQYVKGNFQSKMMKIYNVLAGTLLAFSIIAIIYGAYLMVTSIGFPIRIALGKYVILSAGLSILIILSSYTIMRLVSSFLQL